MKAKREKLAVLLSCWQNLGRNQNLNPHPDLIIILIILIAMPQNLSSLQIRRSSCLCTGELVRTPDANDDGSNTAADARKAGERPSTSLDFESLKRVQEMTTVSVLKNADDKGTYVERTGMPTATPHASQKTKVNTSQENKSPLIISGSCFLQCVKPNRTKLASTNAHRPTAANTRTSTDRTTRSNVSEFARSSYSAEILHSISTICFDIANKSVDDETDRNLPSSCSGILVRGESEPLEIEILKGTATVQKKFY